MSGMWLFLSGLAMAVAALGWWLRHRAPRPVSRRLAPIPAGEGEDALPGGEGEDGLAAFYAYQMAASRIERTSAG